MEVGPAHPVLLLPSCLLCRRDCGLADVSALTDPFLQCLCVCWPQQPHQSCALTATREPPPAQRDKARWHQPGSRVSLSAQLLVFWKPSSLKGDLWDIQQLGLDCGAGSLLRDWAALQPQMGSWVPSQGDPSPQRRARMCRRQSPQSLEKRADSRGINAKNMRRLCGKGPLSSPCLLVCTKQWRDDFQPYLNATDPSSSINSDFWVGHYRGILPFSHNRTRQFYLWILKFSVAMKKNIFECKYVSGFFYSFNKSFCKTYWLIWLNFVGGLN